ncbi:MAG: MFS transporter [Dysgonamonadaceae bacterium]|jgi:MFS family permease|nr:MFS transporter [Dysgonamonadaceae bacterium]
MKKYYILRIASAAANQMLSVAVGYQIYELSKSALLLGVVGLIQFLPRIIFIFYTGTFSDKYDRRKIAQVTQTIILAISLLLGLMSISGVISEWLLLATVFLYGTSFAIEGPAITSLLPNMVQNADLSKALAKNSSFQQAAIIIGPALAGLLYSFGSSTVYFSIIFINLVAVICAHAIKDSEIINKSDKHLETESRVQATVEGFKFIWNNKGILGALTLDMFAVLFGGITALLPIYCDIILHVDSAGFGLLRAAPAVGAIIMAVFLSQRPIKRAAGHKMFLAVAAFGLITILFALSRNFALSLSLLIFLGMADQISVIIRQTFVQLKTPDEVRGRVSAVNFIFIGASNQIGEFESGSVTALIGLIPATIFGGCATLTVVLLWFVWFKELRHLDRI